MAHTLLDKVHGSACTVVGDYQVKRQVDLLFEVHHQLVHDAGTTGFEKLGAEDQLDVRYALLEHGGFLCARQACKLPPLCIDENAVDPLLIPSSAGRREERGRE